MPPQSNECIKQKWGVENYEKLTNGGIPATPLGPEIMQPCFAQGVEQRDAEAARKPPGQEERDAEAARMGGGNVLRLLDVFVGWMLR